MIYGQSGFFLKNNNMETKHNERIHYIESCHHEYMNNVSKNNAIIKSLFPSNLNFFFSGNLPLFNVI